MEYFSLICFHTFSKYWLFINYIVLFSVLFSWYKWYHTVHVYLLATYFFISQEMCFWNSRVLITWRCEYCFQLPYNSYWVNKSVYPFPYWWAISLFLHFFYYNGSSVSYFKGKFVHMVIVSIGGISINRCNRIATSSVITVHCQVTLQSVYIKFILSPITYKNGKFSMSYQTF